MKGDAIRLVWRKGAVLLALVSQSCSSSVAFLSGPSLLRPNAFIHPFAVPLCVCTLQYIVVAGIPASTTAC